MKEYIVQSKSGVVINFTFSVKNEMIRVLVKMIIYGILACVILNVTRHVKLRKIVMLKIVHAKNVCLVNYF